MLLTIVIGGFVFILGEILVNYTIFKYIKNYFKENSTTEEPTEKKKEFIYLDISTFKGVLERFVLFLSLYCGFTPILVVFGALKLGTRLDSKNSVGNDYFLVGNFTSILVAVLYTIIHQKLLAVALSLLEQSPASH